MESTLEHFARSQTHHALVAAGNYPKDWSLFDTGDPAPGNPFDWNFIYRMWKDKAQLLESALFSYRSTGELAGQGYKVRYLNESLNLGEDFVRCVQREFERMGEVAQNWEPTLCDMQGRAKQAHRIARQAHESVVEYSAKVAGLSADMGYLREESERQEAQEMIAGFNSRLSDAQEVLEHQRQVVRDLAGEYKTVGARLCGQYVLASVGRLRSLAHSHQGRPSFALSNVAAGSLFELSPEAIEGNPPVSAHELKVLAHKSADSPEALGEYLSKLSLLSPAELATLARQHPELAHLPVKVSNDGVGNAQVVRAWWNADGADAFGLTQEQRVALLEQLPGFVGNLEGVRYADRDRANRILLGWFLANPWELSDYAEKALLLIQSVLEKEQKGAPRYLINLDLSNMNISFYKDRFGVHRPMDTVATDDVMTTIALGDLDEAEAVTIFNPGMKNHPKVSLDPDNGDMDGMAQKIYRDQEYIYRQNNLDTKHAVIINLNYITPQGADVLGMQDAKVAAERNANSVDALNVMGNNLTFEDQNRQVYLWNHSYGSTTAGETIRKVKTPVAAYLNDGAAGWSEYYFDHPDAASLEYLAKDDQGRPQMYSSLADADDVARGGEYASGRFDPRALKNSFTVSAEASADGRFGAVQGHSVNPSDGSGYNSSGMNIYNSGLLVTTGQSKKIDPAEIQFNADYPEWVYRRGTHALSNEKSHKNFIFEHSK